MEVVVEVDGGSRGNPGPAGYGAVVFSADRSAVLAEAKQSIGRATNNVAEYQGLIAGLDAAAELGATDVAVWMDSKLVVEQMSGRWKVKHPDLIELHAQARQAAARFDRISYDMDSEGAQRARRPVGQRGDGRRGRRASWRVACRAAESHGHAVVDSAGLDRRARYTDPAAVAPTRADPIVVGAALLRTRQPGTD